MPEWGLQFKDERRREQPIALRGVTVSAQMVDSIAEVCVTQEYQSLEKNPCEAVRCRSSLRPLPFLL